MRKSIFFVSLMLVLSLMSCTPEPKPLQLGTIERDTLLGVPCCVYLPCCYAERTKETFPVLYLQHGMYGNEDDWAVQGNLLAIMDSLLRAGKVAEMVIVMPDNFLGSIPPEERQALMDAPNVTPDGEPFDVSKGTAHWHKLTYEQEKNYEMSGYWESHFPQFMAEAESRYRVSTDPAHRAIAGLSMGGFHTLHVSHFLHGQFACVGLFSALVARPDYSVYANWEEEVLALMATRPVYWIGMGKDDFLYDQLQEYRRWLEANHLEYTYYESPGGHTWPNWQDYIGRFLPKISAMSR